MTDTFLKVLENRRSVYSIGKEPSVSEEEILSIVRRAVIASPSAFNSQSSRAIVLFGKEHDKLWDDTKAILKGIVPAENFAKTEEKIDSFRGGTGTVLYFEDQNVVTGLQERFPLYKDNFPVWSLQSSGMLQLAVWSALEEAGLGASLQHYNPLIDEKVRQHWGAPKNWKLLGQMPFGSVTGNPGPKENLPVDERVKVFR
ncbi:nitroreductase family protein [Caproicibacter sp.]|uniref:nitroreductase family protein n=1 Tax=Caproicibacter sp. TaxID=2814884 RepID=UPI0039892BA1